MGSPYFNLPEDQFQSPFLDLYNRFYSNPSSQFGDYVDPSDPDFKRYLDLASSPTGSESMIRDYIDRRPTYEDYQPSTGRKIASFVLGALAGGNDPSKAYTLTQRHLYAPLEQEMSDWKTEGSNIAGRARLMDAERSRELGAMRYGLQARGAAERAKATAENRRISNARMMASERAREEERFRDDEDRRAREQWHQNMSEAIFGLRKDQLNEADARRRAKEALDESTFKTIGPRLETYASRVGINPIRTVPTASGTKQYKMQEFELANEIALKAAMDNPAFRDIIGNDPEEGYYVMEGIDPRREAALKIFIDNIRTKYLKGDF